MGQSAPANENEQQEGPLPTSSQDLLKQFDELGIEYALHEHERVFTVAESSKIEKGIEGLHCRNLFLRDKKKKMYLVVAANETQIDLKKLQGVIGSDRLSFGSADRLWQYLGVRPGSVCPFAIVNDTQGAVEMILDANMMDADIVCYHPMENNMTVGIGPDDLVKFIRSTDHEPRIIDMGPAAPDEE